MKAALIFAALLACGAADAQTYIGGSVAQGKNTGPGDNKPPPHFFATYDQKGSSVSAFAGKRYDQWGIEGGVFALPKFTGNGYTPDYTAYKGYADPTHPKTAQITGIVSGTALYARGQVYGPEVYRLTPYAFAGAALSFNKVHQFGYYDSTDFVEHKQRFHNFAPIVGVGVQYAMTPRLSARVEYLQASGIVKNPHTGKRNVEMLSLGLVYQWGSK